MHVVHTTSLSLFRSFVLSSQIPAEKLESLCEMVSGVSSTCARVARSLSFRCKSRRKRDEENEQDVDEDAQEREGSLCDL